MMYSFHLRPLNETIRNNDVSKIYPFLCNNMDMLNFASFSRQYELSPVKYVPHTFSASYFCCAFLLFKQKCFSLP